MSSPRGIRALERGRRRRAAGRGVLPDGGVAFVLLVGIVTGLCILYIAQATTIAALTSKLVQARAVLTETEDINQTLQSRIDQALSLERVSQAARNRLGMVDPEVIRYVRVSP